MSNQFQLARDQGYSDEEIINHISKSDKYSSKIKLARENGYTDEQIANHLSQSPIESAQPIKQESVPEERNAIDKYLIRPKDIAVQGAIHGARSLPRTAFELLKAGSSKLGADTSKLEEFQENQPEWVKKAAKAVFPTFEQSQEQFGKFNTNPESAIEKGIQKAGRFAGESVFTGGLGGLRGASGIAGAATGAQVGEELNLNPWAQAALTLTGGIAGAKASGGVKGASKHKITPEVESYMQASKDLGIDPILTGMNPSQLQKVAQKWATHGIGGPEILKDAYVSRSDQVSKAFSKAMDEAGSQLFNSPQEAGQGLKEGIQEATRQIEFNKSQLYRAVDNAIPPAATVKIRNPPSIENAIERAKQGLEDTLSFTPPESSVYRRLKSVEKQLEELTDNLSGEVPVRTLEATNRSLNDVIKYEKPGGVDKLLVPLGREIRAELDIYGKTNPKYATARKAANEYFSDSVVHIRQNLLTSIAKSQKPESTLAIMNTGSGIDNVKKALDSLPHGKRMYESLRRYKLESMLIDKIIDPATGIMKVDGLKHFLDRKSAQYPVIEKLAGPQGIATLKKLQEAGKGLEKGFNNLVNPSRTADTLIAINSVLRPGEKIFSGAGKILSGNLQKGIPETILGTAQLVAPKWVASKMLDPKFAEHVFMLSKAAKAKDWKSFNRILDSIDDQRKKDEKKQANL